MLSVDRRRSSAVAQTNSVGRKTMRFLRTVVFFLATQIMPQPSEAQVVNDGKIFPREQLCAGYLEFLSNEEIKDFGDCRQPARFVIGSSEMPIDEFLESLSELAGERSNLGLMAKALMEGHGTQPQDVFRQAAAASQAAAISMGAAHDFERATLYAYLFQYLQSSVAMQLCRPDLSCGGLRPQTNIGGLMGYFFIELDQKPVKRVAQCLLRTDGYLVPIREVLDSDRFRECVGLEAR